MEWAEVFRASNTAWPARGIRDTTNASSCPITGLTSITTDVLKLVFYPTLLHRESEAENKVSYHVSICQPPHLAVWEA